jgi:hypothetical protein
MLSVGGSADVTIMRLFDTWDVRADDELKGKLDALGETVLCVSRTGRLIYGNILSLKGGFGPSSAS